MREIIAIVIVVVFLLGTLYPLEAQEVKKPKSERTALLWSVGGTGLIFTLYGTVVGLTAGPSFGHFYAGQWGRGLITSGIRVGALALADSGMDKYASGLMMPTVENWTPVAIGLITILGTTLYDIFTAPSSVRKYNESIKKSSVYLIPKVDLKEESYGLSAVYSF